MQIISLNYFFREVEMLKNKSRPILITLLMVIVSLLFAMVFCTGVASAGTTKYISPDDAKKMCNKIESNLLNKKFTYAAPSYEQWHRAVPTRMVCCTLGAWAYYYALPEYCGVTMIEPSRSAVGNVNYCPSWDSALRNNGRIYGTQSKSNFEKGDAVLYYGSNGVANHFAIWAGNGYVYHQSSMYGDAIKKMAADSISKKGDTYLSYYKVFKIVHDSKEINVNGEINVTKQCSDGKISGITIKLTGTTNDGHTVSMTGKTNSNGKYTFRNLKAGKYTVKEVVPTGYKCVSANGSSRETTISKSYTTRSFIFKNEPKTVPTEVSGKIKVTKSCSDGKVEGIEFTLTGTHKGGGAHSEKGYTNASGVVTFDDLPEGDYEITETVPEDYSPVGSSTQSVKVTESKTYTLNFVNKPDGHWEPTPDPDPTPTPTPDPDPGTLIVTKTSDDGVVSGVSFTLYNASTNQTITTNSSGKATASLDPGTYYVWENDIPDRYEDPGLQSVTIVENGTSYLTFNNKLKANGSLEIHKTSEDGNVSGISFYIEKEDGTYSNVITTDASGIARATHIPTGTYKVYEMLDGDTYEYPDPQTVEVTDTGSSASVTFHNKLLKSKLKIIKKAEDGQIANIQFKLQSQDGTFEQTYTTNEDGEINAEIEPGSYVLTEINRGTQKGGKSR